MLCTRMTGLFVTIAACSLAVSHKRILDIEQHINYHFFSSSSIARVGKEKTMKRVKISFRYIFCARKSRSQGRSVDKLVNRNRIPLTGLLFS